MKKRFVAPILRLEASLTDLTLLQPAVSGASTNDAGLSQ